MVLGVAHPHNGRDGSDALVEAKDILMQRGSTPRVYRNMLVFIAADARQLDNLKDAVRASLAWGEIVRDTKRLNLTQSDSALAEAKLAEANEKQHSAEAHLRRHVIFARAVTLFQIAIAIGAISALTNRRPFWFVSLAFGAGGILFLVQGWLAR